MLCAAFLSNAYLNTGSSLRIVAIELRIERPTHLTIPRARSATGSCSAELLDGRQGHHYVMLPLQPSLPVHDHRQRRTRRRLLHRHLNQKAAVFAHIELRQDRHLEQRFGAASLKALAVALYLYRHQLAVCADEVQLAAVAAPLRVVAAARRDLPLAAVFREGLYVNFKALGFIRYVGEPLAVWR